MSYGYTGAPALFNGTLPNGGDSSRFSLVILDGLVKES
jgi:Amt family ammonium transporter